MTTTTGLTASLRSTIPPLDVDLSVDPGSVMAVVGPNGAGKTTLLHALAGIRRVEGSVRVAGQDWSTRPAHERSVGLVQQEHALFPHLSAVDNIGFGLRARGVRRPAARRRAGELLHELGLGELCERRPAELSGGQSQRVAIARALAVEPELLLLDEPFAALDVSVAQLLREWLTTRLASYPGVALLVTHDPIDVFTVAERVLVLEEGRVAQQGTPAQVASRPSTSHAARLAGRNVLRGASAGSTITLDDGTLLVAAEEHQGPVIASFSPTSVTLHDSEPQGSARNRWHTRVVSVVRLPHATRVRLARPDILVEVTEQSADQLRIHPGSEVWATLKATELDVLGHQSPD